MFWGNLKTAIEHYFKNITWKILFFVYNQAIQSDILKQQNENIFVSPNKYIKNEINYNQSLGLGLQLTAFFSTVLTSRQTESVAYQKL